MRSHLVVAAVTLNFLTLNFSKWTFKFFGVREKLKVKRFHLKILCMNLYEITILKIVGGTGDIFGSKLKTLKIANHICRSSNLIWYLNKETNHNCTLYLRSDCHVLWRTTHNTRRKENQGEAKYRSWEIEWMCLSCKLKYKLNI